MKHMRGVARLGMAGPGVAWRGMARRGKARPKRETSMIPRRSTRIECWYCDAQHDCTMTIRELRKAGWRKIERVRTFAHAIRESTDEPDNRAWDWQTHMGTCPSCAALEEP